MPPMPERLPGEPPWVRRLILPVREARVERQSALDAMADDGYVPAGEFCFDLEIAGIPMRDALTRPRLIDLPGLYAVELELEAFAPAWSVSLASRLQSLPGTSEEGRDGVLAETVITPAVQTALCACSTEAELFRLYTALT